MVLTLQYGKWSMTWNDLRRFFFCLLKSVWTCGERVVSFNGLSTLMVVHPLCRPPAATAHRFSPWSILCCTVRMCLSTFGIPSNLNQLTVNSKKPKKHHFYSRKMSAKQIFFIIEQHLLTRTWSKKSNSWLMSYVMVGVFGFRRFKCSS